MGDQANQQRVVASHTRVTEVGTKRPREGVDVRKSTASTGKQEASTNTEKGKEHPEDIEEEKAEGIQTGYRKRWDLGARWLVEHTGIEGFACKQRTEEQDGMHPSETNTGSKSTSHIIQCQTILGGLDSSAAVLAFVFVTVFSVFLRLCDGGFNDSLNLEVGMREESTEDELKEDTGNDSRPRATQSNDGIHNVPADGSSRCRQQVKECCGDRNDQELRLWENNLKEEADEWSEADGRGTKHQGFRIGTQVTSHCSIYYIFFVD